MAADAHRRPAGAPLPHQALDELFPHHQYDTNYGLSESTGPGCVHLGLGNLHKVGAIGVPGCGWKVKITDENDQPVPRARWGSCV